MGDRSAEVRARQAALAIERDLKARPWFQAAWDAVKLDERWDIADAWTAIILAETSEGETVPAETILAEPPAAEGGNAWQKCAACDGPAPPDSPVRLCLECQNRPEGPRWFERTREASDA